MGSFGTTCEVERLPFCPLPDVFIEESVTTGAAEESMTTEGGGAAVSLSVGLQITTIMMWSLW